LGRLRPLGQALQSYLVCDAGDRLVLIDTQAARERLIYERLCRERRVGRVEVQPLLMPLVLELNASRSAAAEASLELLAGLGFELDPFGGGSWALKGVPQAQGGADVEALLLELLDLLREAGPLVDPSEALLLRLHSCAARHAAAGPPEALSVEAAAALLEALDSIDLSGPHPGGRPIFIEWSERELARLFHRG
jgi:DNA mismatch repair protein MutL